MPPPADIERPLLIIEDDADHRRLLQESLELVGFRCVVHADGKSALAWLTDHQPHIVVSDWRLPGLHGRPLFEALRQHTTAPIVLLSAYETGARLAPGTVAAHMRKPFELDALVDTLERLSGRVESAPAPAPTRRPLRILLAEDNPADVELVREALQSGPVPHVLEAVTDGAAAIDRLHHQPDRPLPHLVLLDLNLPRLDGFEVLDALKQHPDTLHIPVVMLTTSDDQHDVDEAYRRRVNCFVTKPFEIDQFINAVQVLATYWADVVKMPAPAS